MRDSRTGSAPVPRPLAGDVGCGRETAIKADGAGVSQVLVFAGVARDVMVSLKKVARRHLGEAPCYGDIQDQVILTNRASERSVAVEVRGNRIICPESLLQALGLEAGNRCPRGKHAESWAVRTVRMGPSPSG